MMTMILLKTLLMIVHLVIQTGLLHLQQTTILMVVKMILMKTLMMITMVLLMVMMIVQLVI